MTGPRFISKYLIVASQGYPTLQLRHLVRRAIDIWEHTYGKNLPIYGLWDFDPEGFTQVLIPQSWIK